SNPDETSEGQAGSNPDETSKGQAGPDHGDAEAKVQSISSPVVHVGSDREYMDLDVADVSPQPSTEQLDEWFTATVYPNVQENLKLAVEEPVLLEEPDSSSGTLSSLQHLSRDFSFRDQFFSDKHSDADKNAETKVESMVNVTIQQALSSISLMTSPIIDLTSRPESPKEHQQLKATTTDTTTVSSLQHLSRDFSFGDQFFSDKHSDADKNAKTKVESMVNVTIQQALSSISLMTSPIIDLTSRPESPKEHQQLKATTTDTTTTTTTTLPPSQAPQQSTTEAMMVKRIGELEHIMADLIQVNKDMKERLDSHGSRLHTLEQLDIPQRVSIDLFEALEKSMNRDHSEELAQDLAEARKKKKKSRESPKMPPGSPSHQPPPPPPPAGPFGASGAPRASGSA
nr:hypothetical protein [Tanacetum cinerariifolium]